MATNQTPVEEADLWANQSKRAQGILDYVLKENNPTAVAERESLVAIEEARRAEKILDVDTGRSQSRVLFVTSDQAVFEDNSASQREYVELASQFDEVHILVLSAHKKSGRAKRLTANVWLYPATGVSVWSRVYNARSVASHHLRFNDSVRPDIIVAKDPQVAAVAAYLISQVLHRPYQIHITAPDYGKQRNVSWLKRLVYRHVLRNAHGVAAMSEEVVQLVQKWVAASVTVTQLPIFYNFSQYADSTPQFDLHKKYPQYTFFILASGPLTADSHLHDTFTALHTILHNPRIALVVIGDGKARGLFVQKAQLLEISENVIFLSPQQTDLVSCYRSADLMVETGLSTESEQRILRAIMATLPVAAYETKLRNDLFTDGDSAYLAESGDTIGLMQKINLFLNQSAMRSQFAQRMRTIAASRLHENPITHQRAMRDVIETTLLAQFAMPEIDTEVESNVETAGDESAEALAPTTQLTEKPT